MSSHTLKSLHERVGGELHGDASTQITGVAIIRDATPGDITLAGDAKFSESLKDCDASAVIVAKGVSSHGLPCIEAVSYTHLPGGVCFNGDATPG